MPIRYKPGCRTCNASRGNPKLRKRIYDAHFNREPGDESLGNIAEELGFNEANLRNHCKKHITFAPVKAPLMVEKNVEKLKAMIAKRAELAVDHEQLSPLKDYEHALTTVIAEGMDELRKGGKKVTVSQLIAAAKIKGDFDTKKRGQDAELLKMMMRSASGLTGEPPKVD